MEHPLLWAENISKVFVTGEAPLQIFSHVFLKIFPQDTISCVGRSGEGKSTLLHILGSLDTATTGSLTILGKPLEQWSLLSNVILPAKIARKATHRRSFYGERARMLIARVGLESRLYTKVKWLAGGERQRVAIARALIMDPMILFADEPTGNLDSLTASAVIDLLFETVVAEQKALFLVTHQHDLAARCRYRFRLDQGQLEEIL